VEKASDLRVRIVVADSCPVMRIGLKTILSQVGRVVGETSHSEELLQLARRLRPDLVVLNLNLSGKPGGIEICRGIKDSFDAPCLLVHTAHNYAEHLSSCAQAGVDGYLHTHSKPAEFVDALHRIIAGEPVWEIGRDLKQEELIDSTTTDDCHLTSRECEVMRLKFQRHSNAEIARLLGISIHTVKHHVTHINKKVQTDKVVRFF
jgi:DNA-binding NarL/FixJ family response regulator